MSQSFSFWFYFCCACLQLLLTLHLGFSAYYWLFQGNTMRALRTTLWAIFGLGTSALLAALAYQNFEP